MTTASEFTGKRVLITGGLGFIGSNLARRLLQLGATVTVTDSLNPLYGGNRFNIEDIRDRIEVHETDVRDKAGMARLVKDQDYLLNLAGQTSHLDSMTDPQTDLDINAGAQLSILEACRNFNPSVKLVFASTRQLYGKPEYLPVDESHPIRPVDVNGINKLAGEWYHLLYNNVYGIRACALRLTNTYGPGMRVKDARQTFLGIWIRRVLEGQPIVVYGDGSQLRDFNYVDDAVDAILRAASAPEAYGRVFNLGSREVVSLNQLARMIVALHPSAKVEHIPFPPERKAIDIGDYYSDFSSIESVLGWRPETGLEQGLRATLDYYARNRRHYWEATA
jgi:dTDP-glucose 4,6-dehydratase/UDP-glucose 4-epimerase